MGEVGTPTSTAAGMPQAPEGEGWAPTNVLARCISDPASFSFMMTVISVVMVVALMMMMMMMMMVLKLHGSQLRVPLVLSFSLSSLGFSFAGVCFLR